MQDPSGETVKITELGPGALIGEMALVGDGRRSASVRALEVTTLVSVSPKELHTAMKKSGSLQSRLTQTVATRFQEMLGLLEKKKSDAAAANSGEPPLLLDKSMIVARVQEILGWMGKKPEKPDGDTDKN